MDTALNVAGPIILLIGFVVLAALLHRLHRDLAAIREDEEEKAAREIVEHRRRTGRPTGVPDHARRHGRLWSIAAAGITAAGAWLVQALRPRPLALAGAAVATGAITVIPGSIPPHMQTEDPHTARATLSSERAPGPGDLTPVAPEQDDPDNAGPAAGSATIEAPTSGREPADTSRDPGGQEPRDTTPETDPPANPGGGPADPAPPVPDPGPEPMSGDPPGRAPGIKPPGNPDAPGRGLGDQPPPGLTNGPPPEPDEQRAPRGLCLPDDVIDPGADLQICVP